MSEKENIAVLITVHNRRETTIRCLVSLFEQTYSDSLSVYLVDDGSTDGTFNEVSRKFPQVKIIIGDGNLFWNGGMRVAYEEAMKTGHNYYLWLNDDTVLKEKAIEDAHSLSVRQNDEKIIVGSTSSGTAQSITYGGYITTSTVKKLNFKLATPGRDHYVDSFCGNFVFIPNKVAMKVGNIYDGFLHRWGDVDYGLRAKKMGIKSLLLEDVVGYCEVNPEADKWKSSNYCLRERLSMLHSHRGLGKKDWLMFTFRHGGLIAPYYFVSPYIRIFYSAIISQLRC